MKESINTEMISEIGSSLDVALSPVLSKEELHAKISQHIAHLINHDFEKLVSLLYRIDVDEKKMRNMLEQQEGENAAGLIADLIIERQLQKIKSRKDSKSNNDIPDDERW